MTSLTSRDIVARAVYEYNKEIDPLAVNTYPIIVNNRVKYFYGYVKEVSEVLSEAQSNTQYPLIINVLPEAAKFRVSADGIKYEDQMLLLALPVAKEWTSEEISYYAFDRVLSPLADAILKSLKSFATVNPSYTYFQGGSIAVIDDTGNNILKGFGDYVAYLLISDLNYEVPYIVCEETKNEFELIFKNVNKDEFYN